MRIGLLCAAMVALAPDARAQAVSMRVVDEAGRPVQGARVVAIDADRAREQTQSDDEGRATLRSAGRFPVRVQVSAGGFAPSEQEVREPASDTVLVTLRAWRVADTITVTASRMETTAARSIQGVSVLTREDEASAAALALDDRLRRIPGFTLFRRASSMVAHPTAQGVSLRGVGPSGASRSLVLADGIPLNDPFGGYVYWGRVPRGSIERIEVLRGGASELYGTDALGGVIQLLRRPPTERTLYFEADGGNLGTGDAALFASHRLGRHGVSVAGELFRTDGWIQVNPAERGRVDVESRSRHHALEASWDYRLGADARLWVVGSEYSERRGNGTPLQNNDSQIRTLAAGSSFVTGRGNQWNVSVFSLAETFDASFTSIAADRSSEALTRTQRVPASSVGASAVWRRAFGARHVVLAGADVARVLGASDEIVFTAGAPASSVRADGRQLRSGFYVQDLFQLTRALEVVAGIRLDAWNNHDAFSFTHTFATGAKRQTPFESRRDTSLSPKLGGRLALTDDLALRGSVSRAFRAPTLNELYRSFRVGNVVTRENPDLGPEHATSGEIGLDWGLRRPLAVRGTWFWTAIDGAIASVTLSSTPSLITRQRQNLGTTHSNGLELDAVFRPDTRWTFSAGYFFANATVIEAPLAADLVGRRIPQVPRHQGVLAASYRRNQTFSASAQLRLSGPQFEDDLNAFTLRRYGVMDLQIAKRVAPGLELVFACENLFDSLYPVGRTPVETVGMPRRLHGGLRVRVE